MAIGCQSYASGKMLGTTSLHEVSIVCHKRIDVATVINSKIVIILQKYKNTNKKL